MDPLTITSTYTSLHYHLVFSTKNRVPHLLPIWREELYAYISGIIRKLNGHPAAIGGTSDHVHILVGLTQHHILKDFVRDVKRSSSIWIRERHRNGSVIPFSWQEGYAALTVSPSVRAGVIDYIRTQEEHHKRLSFQEELETILKGAQINYDPRYPD